MLDPLTVGSGLERWEETPASAAAGVFADLALEEATAPGRAGDGPSTVGNEWLRLNNPVFQALGFVVQGEEGVEDIAGALADALKLPGQFPPGLQPPHGPLQWLVDVETALGGLAYCYLDSINRRITKFSYSARQVVAHVQAGSRVKPFSQLADSSFASYVATFQRLLCFLLRRHLWGEIKAAILGWAATRGEEEAHAAMAFRNKCDAVFLAGGPLGGPLPEAIRMPLKALVARLRDHASPLPRAWDHGSGETAPFLVMVRAVAMGVLDRKLPMGYTQRHEPLLQFLLGACWSEEEGFHHPKYLTISGAHLVWLFRGTVWSTLVPKCHEPRTELSLEETKEGMAKVYLLANSFATSSDAAAAIRDGVVFPFTELVSHRCGVWACAFWMEACALTHRKTSTNSPPPRPAPSSPQTHTHAS